MSSMLSPPGTLEWNSREHERSPLQSLFAVLSANTNNRRLCNLFIFIRGKKHSTETIYARVAVGHMGIVPLLDTRERPGVRTKQQYWHRSCEPLFLKKSPSHLIIMSLKQVHSQRLARAFNRGRRTEIVQGIRKNRPGVRSEQQHAFAMKTMRVRCDQAGMLCLPAATTGRHPPTRRQEQPLRLAKETFKKNVWRCWRWKACSVGRRWVGTKSHQSS